MAIIREDDVFPCDSLDLVVEAGSAASGPARSRLRTRSAVRLRCLQPSHCQVEFQARPRRKPGVTTQVRQVGVCPS
jgi:hypothetical protein